jgi:hypothetical protein
MAQKAGYVLCGRAGSSVRSGQRAPTGCPRKRPGCFSFAGCLAGTEVEAQLILKNATEIKFFKMPPTVGSISLMLARFLRETVPLAVAAIHNAPQSTASRPESMSGRLACGVQRSYS